MTTKKYNYKNLIPFRNIYKGLFLGQDRLVRGLSAAVKFSLFFLIIIDFVSYIFAVILFPLIIVLVIMKDR